MLLGRNRTVHLADFGIARIAAEHAITNAGEMLGTAAYISPEQARGRPATGASDRYSLAVAAFELLVGERPFPAEHFAAQARAHMDDEPPAASEREPALSPAVDPVLMRGMSKDPDKRWPSAGAFADALERAVATRRPRPNRSVGAAAGAPPTLILNADTAGAASPARRGALAALAVAALLVGLLVGSQHGGGTSARNASVRQPAVGSGAARRAQPTKHHAVAKAKAAAQTPKAAAQTPSAAEQTPSAAAQTPRAAAQTPEAAAPVTPAASPTTSAPTASPTPSTSTPAPASANGAALEAHGHQLMIAGSYAAAIPVLRQALAAAGPGQPHLRLRALRPRALASARRRPKRGRPDPRGTAEDPEPDRRRAPRARPRARGAASRAVRRGGAPVAATAQRTEPSSGKTGPATATDQLVLDR